MYVRCFFKECYCECEQRSEIVARRGVVISVKMECVHWEQFRGGKWWMSRRTQSRQLLLGPREREGDRKEGVLLGD